MIARYGDPGQYENIYSIRLLSLDVTSPAGDRSAACGFGNLHVILYGSLCPLEIFDSFLSPALRYVLSSVYAVFLYSGADAHDRDGHVLLCARARKLRKSDDVTSIHTVSITARDLTIAGRFVFWRENLLWQVRGENNGRPFLCRTTQSEQQRCAPELESTKQQRDVLRHLHARSGHDGNRAGLPNLPESCRTGL